MIGKESDILGEQPSPEQKEQKVEQKTFPDRVEIKGATLVGDYGVEQYYEGGVIEIIEECAIRLTGFDFEQPLEYGLSEDIVNCKYFRSQEETKEYQKQHPEPHMSHYLPRPIEWTEWDDEYLENFVNIMFYLGKTIYVGEIDDTNPVVFKLKSKLRGDLLDKFLIILNNFAMDPEAKFIEERPDLTTEIFKFACRNYIMGRSHTSSTPLVHYLLAHPETLDFFPKEYRTCLEGLFITDFAPQISETYIDNKDLDIKEQIKKMEQLIENYYKMTEKLGIDTKTEGMQNQLNSFLLYLESLKKQEIKASK